MSLHPYNSHLTTTAPITSHRPSSPKRCSGLPALSARTSRLNADVGDSFNDDDEDDDDVDGDDDDEDGDDDDNDDDDGSNKINNLI